MGSNRNKPLDYFINTLLSDIEARKSCNRAAELDMALRAPVSSAKGSVAGTRSAVGQMQITIEG
ncbi:uncharacterized protein PHALS_09288 [Plasmopara halstedii]|uniref:Uncharacterized protein n=1 Tax=Plasmopara halstedii TaxID=4781 RepID=A0A0N7L4P3_PLAHL|nr:uncharacterized protein PHALS_09288 [Plasmopara halstedii]CEG39235.1 hypothetical protein PHALS_09288 [Plasmopara halstedii]|eukprot:XP_024575604.1 hypothetical protein PHALS_09288 [Plasmopara halstedii]